MADQLGMEFMNWQNVPSLMDSLNKQETAKFKNPLLSAIGYGLNQLIGQSGQQVIPGGVPAPEQPTVGVSPKQTPPSLQPLPEVTAQPIDYTKFLYSR